MRIKEMPKDSRPRERLLKFGIENLSEAELLALILEKGTKKENVIEVSNRLIAQYGLDKLSECSLKELQEINGIGQAKAMQILALFEISKRKGMINKETIQIKSAKDVFEIFHEKLKDEKQENFYVLMLNSKNFVIGQEKISLGIVDSSIIHPREIFRSAIKNSASRIILVHNHPSGDSSPSKEDEKVTEEIAKAGEVLGIQVLDHVIIGKSYWSWRENK
ncbi:MAG: DNA repair protein RadC [Nanoarchaeota archaeon]|nr:DNA repair protein RadC [Nanoarchaeota archaeon]MBU4086090.1 DNA repair protein RadC [Nanoarchaeota archaeon]